MIINLVLSDNNKLKYENIERYTNLSLFYISCWICTNCFLDINYAINMQLLKYYMFCELLLLPFNRKDLILHHIISILMIQYNCYYNIDVNINYYPLKQVFLTEISSIFLSLSSYIKNTNLPNLYGITEICKNTSMFLFVLTFIKFRLYDFYNNVIVNKYFFDSLTTNDSYTQIIYKYGTSYALFGLNIFWFMLIIKKICKSYLNYSTLYAEYMLQYSYFACLFTTCMSYTLIATSFQKSYYSNYISLDVASNFLLSLTSYEFHKYIYTNLLTNENMNRATTDYKNYLLQDIIILQGRALVQVYCHFHMHNIFETYKYIFYFQMMYSIFLCVSVNAVYCNMISKKISFTIDEVNHISSFLDLLLGSNAFFCVILSTLGVYGEVESINTLIVLYLLFITVTMKPFYKMSHLMVHILMIVQNHCLVSNNLKNL